MVVMNALASSLDLFIKHEYGEEIFHNARLHAGASKDLTGVPHGEVLERWVNSNTDSDNNTSISLSY